MNTSSKKFKLMIAIVPAMIIAVIVADTFHFVIAWHHYVKNESNSALASSATDDLALYEACTTIALPSGSKRDCILKLLPKIQTYIGVMPASALAEYWLSEHRDDIEVRDAAYRMFETGRKSLMASQPIFELQERAISAHNTSYLMRLYHGRLDPTLRDTYADILRKSEFRVRKLFPESQEMVLNRPGQ